MKALKKQLCSVLSVSLLCTMISVPALAEDNISVRLNAQEIEFDVQPQIINERTMVPMRAIFEALGATVDWNGDTKTVTAKKDDLTITTSIGSETIFVNGTAKTMDIAPCIISDRTLVPVRFISEALGYDVSWIGDAATVVIATDHDSAKFYSDFETARYLTMAVLSACDEINLLSADVFRSIADDLNVLANGSFDPAAKTLPLTYGYFDMNTFQTVVQAYKHPNWEYTKNNVFMICDKVSAFNSDDLSPEFKDLISLLKDDASKLKQGINNLGTDFVPDPENVQIVPDLNGGIAESNLLEAILSAHPQK